MKMRELILIHITSLIYLTHAVNRTLPKVSLSLIFCFFFVLFYRGEKFCEKFFMPLKRLVKVLAIIRMKSTKTFNYKQVRVQS